MATVAELKAVLRENGLPLSGNKADLQARLPTQKDGFTPIGVYEVEGVGLCTGIAFAEEQTASFTGKPPVFCEWEYICDTCNWNEGDCLCNEPVKVYPKNPRTTEQAALDEQERDEHRAMMGVPWGVAIGCGGVTAADALPRVHADNADNAGGEEE